METHPLSVRPAMAILLTCVAFLVVSACSEKAAQPKQPEASAQKTTSGANAGQAVTAKKQTPNALFADRPYKIRIVPGDATNGQSAMSIIEITPTSGYKMNQDFPSRLRIDSTKAAELSKTDFRGPDALVSEAKLRFDVAFTPKKAGSIPMSGVVDFSVCNERTCKLYRGERVVWDVAVR